MDSGAQRNLSVNDLMQLAQNPSPSARANLAIKIGQHIEEANQSEREYQLTLDIAYLLARDKHEDVRMALAETVKTSQKTPKEVLLQLANDANPDIAARILEYCDRLTDEELLTIIHTTHQLIKLLAIARRSSVSLEVVGALVDRKIEEVSHALLGNGGADFNEGLYNAVAEEFYDSEEIMQAFMKRHPIPTHAVKHMVERSASMTKDRITSRRDRMLFEHEDVEPVIAEELRLILSLGENPSERNCQELADRLNRSGSLSPILLASLLMMGNHRLFVACMALRTKMDSAKIEQLYHGNYHSFRQFYDLSRLPYGMHRLFWHLKCSADEILELNIHPNSYEFFTSASQMLDIADMECIPYTNRVGYAAAKLMMDFFIGHSDGAANAGV